MYFPFRVFFKVADIMESRSRSNGGVSFQLCVCRWQVMQSVEGTYFTWYATLQLQPIMQSSDKLVPRYYLITLLFEFFLVIITS